MRKLTRPEPPAWWGEFEQKCNEELTELIASSPHKAIPSGYLGKSRFYRERRVRNDVVDLLSEASNGACHACGSNLVEKKIGIEHYRPKINAGDQKKDRRFPRHYWWLLADWNNLQVICPTCNRYKRSLFPTAAERAEEGARGNALAAEGALIINPFDDDPLDHFRLGKDGKLIGLSERGSVTINIYVLNREALVSRRVNHLQHYRSLIPAKERRLRSVAEQEKLTERLLQQAGPSDIGFVPLIVGALTRVTGAPTKSQEDSKALSTKATKRSLQDGAQTGWIKDVKIRDFGPIEALDISFPSISSDKEPWLGIVGENGVGKSTFLKAVALALMDEKTAQSLIDDASKLKNRNTRRRSGFVEITMSDDRKRRLTVRCKSAELEYSGDAMNIPVIALGANRISSHKGAAKDLPTSTAVNNLFDPVLPLVDTEEWLADTARVSAANFSVLGDNLKSLMDLPISTEVTRRKGTIFFQRQNSRQSLDEMSDGFRSVIGLTAHIMKYLAAETPVMSEAEGTVLLDELELHLHPSWKVQIVTKLRELFPRVRFIITTHDPLCLRGFERDETHVFRRNPDSDEIESRTLSIQPGMTVDDLLTGGWFGLGTTYDQDTEDKIHELSALSLKEDALKLNSDKELSKEEKDEIKDLSMVLSKRLAGFSSSESDRAKLSEVARSTIDLEDGEALQEIDSASLQDRIKQAFGKGE